MQLTCPACRKAGQGEARCERCGCDLTRLRAVAAAAAEALGRAEDALRRGRWTDAGAEAIRSWQLRRSARAAGVGLLAAGAEGDTAAAMGWRRSVRSQR